MIELTKESYKPVEERMAKTIQVLHEEFHAIRAGRANPHVLDRIAIDYYGTRTPIHQVANIQVPEARLITITPWDPSTLREIEKAIQTSDLGIHPNNDGKTIRLVFPSLTEERRRDLVRQVSRLGEEAKVAIRNIRRDVIDKYKDSQKKKEMTTDMLADAEVHIQKITDRFIAEIDKAIVEKEKDLMEV